MQTNILYYSFEIERERERKTQAYLGALKEEEEVEVKKEVNSPSIVRSIAKREREREIEK